MGNDCDEFADCFNTNGSYTCSCKDGYQGNGKECAEGEMRCLCFLPCEQRKKEEEEDSASRLDII